MKWQIIALLSAGTFFTVTAQDARFITAASTSTTTTTITTTTDGENNTKETTTTVTTTTTDEDTAAEENQEETVSPEEGKYTYEEYEGEYVACYKGYYYIGGVWVWRRPGKPPIPPPHFRPVPRNHGKAPAHGHAPAKKAPAKAAAPKTAPVKTTPVKRTPVKSAPHHGGARPAAPGGHR